MKKYTIKMEGTILVEDVVDVPVPPIEPPIDPPPIEPPAEPQPIDPPVDPIDPSLFPESYFPLVRADSLHAELTTLLQENVWAGTRDPEYVHVHCPDTASKFFGMTNEELLEFANEGLALDKEGVGFLNRLPQINKRCIEDSRFCGRSQVRKDRYQDYKAKLLAHLTKARELRDTLAGQPGYGEAYNSIKGYCEYVNKNT